MTMEWPQLCLILLSLTVVTMNERFQYYQNYRCVLNDIYNHLLMSVILN